MDPVPPRALRADCPPWLQEVILKCLEVKPERPLPERRAARAGAAGPDAGDADRTRRTARGRASRWQALEALVLRGRRRRRARPEGPRLGIASQVMTSPIIVAAVDVDQAAPALLDQLRETVRRIVVTEPGARLACVSVMRTGAHRHGRARRRPGPEPPRQAAGRR